MKHWMTSLGLVMVSAIAGPAAFAATYYLSDCQQGAAAGCVAGSSANDGLSAAKPKQTYGQLPARKGGDIVLFAKGGAWTNASMRIYVPTATATNPVTWDSYTPPWGGTAKPILTEARPGTYLFNFDDGSGKAPDGGYVIRNLDLRGGGVMGASSGGQAGIFLIWTVDDVLMENLDISGFKFGVHSSHNPKSGGTSENHRITLRNSRVHNNTNASFLGGAVNLLIENNIFDRNGTVAVFDHDIYISSSMAGVIRNNTISRSVLNSNGKCSGSVIVVHGEVDGLLIENNKILQPASGGIPQCYGIEVSGGYADTSPGEYFHDVIIRGNTVADIGFVGIGVRGCSRCIVENNAVIWSGAGGSQGISMGMNSPSGLDELGTGLTIRNNSIYFQTTTGAAVGVRLINEGTKHAVTGNIIYFGAAAPASAAPLCFDTSTYTIAEFTAFNNNLCFRSSGPLNYSAAHATLAVARSAGFDLNGVAADPMFVAIPSATNGYSLAVSGASPAVGAGNPTLSAPKDIMGRLRGAKPDLGAYQGSSGSTDAVAPGAPAGLVVQ